MRGVLFFVFFSHYFLVFSYVEEGFEVLYDVVEDSLAHSVLGDETVVELDVLLHLFEMVN